MEKIKQTHIWDATSQFQGITSDCGETQVCQFSFKIMQFPDQVRFRTHNQQQSDFRDFMMLYRLVYCVDCSIPVYWMCLGENIPVQLVSINDQEYLVFHCDACQYKRTNPDKEVCCKECRHQEGYLKKLAPININEQPKEFEFVHPVCALSFPNIYQMGGPGNMHFKLCSGVDSKEIDKPTEPVRQCDICHESTARMLNCWEYEKHQKSAHAWCIMNNNLEMVYQNDVGQNYAYEDNMDAKWTIQLFFKNAFNQDKDCFDKLGTGAEFSYGPCSEEYGTTIKHVPVSQRAHILNTQSPFMRVLCHEQRKQVVHCQCDNTADDNLTQCQSCHNWYHQECWGDHVDIVKSGPSQKYFRKFKDEAKEGVVKTTKQDEKDEDQEMADEEGEEEEDQEMSASDASERDDFLLCEKCMQLAVQVNSPVSNERAFANIILGKKNIESFLPFVNNNWSTCQSLLEI